MDFIIIAIITVILMVILAYFFGYNIKKVKQIAEDKELDELASRYPNNIEIAKAYLKKLNNQTVKIEENTDTEASLYIAVTNKISIANIANTYTRIQTIAHECLHSIQERKILLFNVIFSNLYILYFFTICILAIFKLLPNQMLYLNIYLLLSMVYYMVRIYLENDAMIKARYLAKEYMEEEKICSPDQIKKMVQGFDRINNMGIKCVNYKIFLNIMVKLLIFVLICIIR